jgi:hypothetical protein
MFWVMFRRTDKRAFPSSYKILEAPPSNGPSSMNSWCKIYLLYQNYFVINPEISVLANFEGAVCIHHLKGHFSVMFVSQ